MKIKLMSMDFLHVCLNGAPNGSFQITHQCVRIENFKIQFHFLVHEEIPRHEQESQKNYKLKNC